MAPPFTHDRGASARTAAPCAACHDGAMNKRFSYSGSATVGGVTIPGVRLMENGPVGGLRSWGGSASVAIADAPGGFPGNLNSGDQHVIELSDGRKGNVLVTNVGFNGRAWTVELTGTGPAPE